MEAVIETFRPVKEYEGLYEVSDYGAVRSLDYHREGKVMYLKPVKFRGYERIYLCRDGKRKQFKIHRLVWEAFVGPIPAGMEIDHVNAIRDDNRLDNLRVVTHKENMANQITAVRLRESTREANRRKAKDPKWRDANREAAKRRSKDPKWRDANREGTRKACNKPILQLDKVTGEVIREWECMMDVERELGIDHSSISACCHGKLKSTGGFRWCFVSD